MSAWEPQNGAEELTRTRDAKHYKNPDGTYTGVFGRAMHYQKDGAWHEINRNFRADGNDFVADELPFIVRLTGANLAVTDRDTGKGIRYIVPASAVVAGNTVSFKWAGYDFSYRVTSTGIKLQGAIPSKRGNSNYQFTYTLMGVQELYVDSSGNLVGDGFTVNRPVAIGADHKVYDCGEWKLTGNRISFSFDDSDLPDDAYPYTLDPSTTFNVAVSGDDATQGCGAATYPPTGPYNMPASEIEYVERNYNGATYGISTSEVRWDTSSLDDAATVTGTTFQYVSLGNTNADSRNLVVEWYANSNWPLGTKDWTSTAPASPVGSAAVAGHSAGTAYQMTLSGAAANVSKTSYTGIRCHISGGQPTGGNDCNFASWDHLTYTEPRLIVDYTTGGAGTVTRSVTQYAALSVPVVGATYYVATNGSDSNPGTFALPFKQIATGLARLAVGDTLYIRGGTYVQSAGLSVNASGTAENPITVASYPGETAIISGDTDGDGFVEVATYLRSDGVVCTHSDAPGSWWSWFVNLNGDYIVFENIEVCYAGGGGVAANGDHDIVRGCHVHHTWSTAIKANDPSTNALIENNTVHDASICNYSTPLTGTRRYNGTWDCGIGAGGTVGGPLSVGATIRGNTIYHSHGEGIIINHGSNVTIEDNTIYDCWALLVDLNQTPHSTVQRNLLYYTSDSDWWRGSPIRPWTGILISNEGMNGYATVASDIKIANNIVIGAGCGSIAFWSGALGALVDCTIANNTIINPYSTNPSISIDSPLAGYAHSGTRIANNVVYQSSGVLITCPTTSGITFDHNAWAWSPGASFSGTGDVIGDPRLVDPNHAVTAGATLADWYKLAPSSPCTNAGATIATITDDYDKQSRSGTYDIGADEYGGGRAVVQNAVLGAFGVTRTVIAKASIGTSMPTRSVVQKTVLLGSLVRNVVETANLGSSSLARTALQYAALTGLARTRTTLQYVSLGGIGTNFYLYATGGTPSIPLSNVGRSFDSSTSKLVKEHRLADGTMRRKLVAEKKTFTFSWKFLPSLTADVIDGGLGLNALETLLSGSGTLVLRVPTDSGAYGIYTVFPAPDPIKKTIALRRANGKHYWDVTMTLVEA